MREITFFHTRNQKIYKVSTEVIKFNLKMFKKMNYFVQPIQISPLLEMEDISLQNTTGPNYAM